MTEQNNPTDTVHQDRPFQYAVCGAPDSKPEFNNSTDTGHWPQHQVTLPNAELSELIRGEGMEFWLLLTSCHKVPKTIRNLCKTVIENDTNPAG